MRSVLSVCVLVLAGHAALPAQLVNASAVVTNDLSVRTPVGSRTFRAQPVPPGGVDLTITRQGMNASTRVTLDVAPTAVTYRTVDEWSVNSSYPGPHGRFGNGRHGTLLSLRTARPVPGRVRITVSSVASARTTLFGTVDVGNDGSIELTVMPGPQQVVEIPMLVSGSLDVALLTGTSGSTVAGGGLQRGRIDLTVQLVPAATCNPQRYLDTCEPFFSLAPTFGRDIEFAVTSNLNAQTGFVMLGTLNFGLPLPRSIGCGFLALHPQVIVPAPLQAGRAVVTVPARGARPLQFRCQGGVLADIAGMPQIYTTWAYLVSCP